MITMIKKRAAKKIFHGFTLVELLVVMSIIAILMAISLVSYQSAQQSARDGRRKADLEQVRSALEMYRADCGGYPSSTLVSGQAISCSGNVYMTIPSDPNPSYRYYYTPNGNGYRLYACLETQSGGCSGSGDCGVVCNYFVTP